MKLRELLSKSDCFKCESPENPEIVGVSTDSRKITEGELFIAIPGYRDDGRRYIEAARVRGAAAVLVD